MDHTDSEDDLYTELFQDENQERPLIPDDELVDPDQEYIYSPDGTLTETKSAQQESEDSTTELGSFEDRSIEQVYPPCSHTTLDGSWYIQLEPRVGPGEMSSKIHGAMRIESRDIERLRVSGDIYIESLTTEDDQWGPETNSPDDHLSIKQNWYPQFSPKKYSWYFKSQGVRYSGGRLTCNLERHIWNPRSGDFSQTDVGTIALNCRKNQITGPNLPAPTIRITGKATFGGRKFTVTATKTSPYYRGCHIEADVMMNRQWTGEAFTPSGENISFNGVYQDAGLEFRATLDSIDIPEDTSLSTDELYQLLSTHRTQYGSRRWHLWLLIGSQYSTSGTLGVMFDDVPPYREGAVAFYDPLLSNSSLIRPDIQGKKIGEVPLAILRTALHEIGHALNLWHPKHDTHSVSVGTTIMNQTGDVMGFASPSNPYPDNATFAFCNHNSTSLVHSPDPQVRPGWTRFGYGHGGRGNPPGEPHDIIFDRDIPHASNLTLKLSVPDEVYPGEFVLGAAQIHNVGDEPQVVPTALNLEEDYLSVYLTPPNGDPIQVRDVLLVCSDRNVDELAPDDYWSGYIQFMYTNQEYTFDQAGQYTLQAELDLGGRVVRSEPVDVLVRSPLSEEELELSTKGLDTDVGRSIALGIPPVDTPAEKKLTSLAEEYPETDIGTAAAIVVANTRHEDTIDYREDNVVREADEDTVMDHMDIALTGYDATDVARIATAVVPVSEAESPLFDQLVEQFQDKDYDEADIEHAEAVIADYQQTSGSDPDIGADYR